MARLGPALRLIAEAGVITSYLVRWSPDRSLQQMSDLVLQDLVGRKPDRVAGTLGFKKLVDLGIGEGGVASEIQMLHNTPVTSITGSSTARQPSALWTLPGLSAHRSTSPNWLNTNSGW